MFYGKSQKFWMVSLFKPIMDLEPDKISAGSRAERTPPEPTGIRGYSKLAALTVPDEPRPGSAFVQRLYPGFPLDRVEMTI